MQSQAFFETPRPKKKKKKSLPGSGYHGTLVNSMQPLHVIFLFICLGLFIFLFFYFFSQWTCQEEKGQMCTQSSKRNLILFVTALKTSRGGSQRVHCSPLAGKVGKKKKKPQLESAEKRQQSESESLPSALQISEDIIGTVHDCERNVPLFDWNGFFFFFPPLLLYYRSADGLFSHCDKRAQSRAQRDTWAGRRRWRSNNNNNKRRKKRAHQFWLQEDGNELKPEYLINKMLKYWGSGSVWPVCALCAQDIYSICVCLHLYVCILNMLLLSPAGRTQHCILPSLLSWFGLGFFVFFWLRWKKKKVNIIKNRCGWNKQLLLCHELCCAWVSSAQITSNGLLMTTQHKSEKNPAGSTEKQTDCRDEKVAQTYVHKLYFDFPAVFKHLWLTGLEADGRLCCMMMMMMKHVWILHPDRNTTSWQRTHTDIIAVTQREQKFLFGALIVSRSFCRVLYSKTFTSAVQNNRSSVWIWSRLWITIYHHLLRTFASN